MPLGQTTKPLQRRTPLKATTGLKRTAFKVKPAKAKKAPTERKGLIKECDRIFSIEIRRINGGVCQRCGKTTSLQCSHVISRKYLALRWDYDNAICLCQRCHIYWWHKEPLEAAHWFDMKWPGRYIRLLLKRSTTGKVDVNTIYATLTKAGV